MAKFSELIKGFFKNWKNVLIVIVIAIIVALLLVVYFQHNKVVKLKNKYETEVKLKDALVDTVHLYQNKQKEWVAEKLTIQESVKNLEKINGQLTASQKEMVARIKEVEKKNDIIVAALIETHVKLDSLLHKGQTVVDTTHKKVMFSDWRKDGKKEIKYKLTVGNVIPSQLGLQPTLFIDSLDFPNKQFIEFHWKNDKKKGYPVAFSVSNSNDYFKTVNVDSYAIPKLSKEVLDPNGWQKIGNFFKRSGKTVGTLAVGAAGGATLFWILTK